MFSVDKYRMDKASSSKVGAVTPCRAGGMPLSAVIFVLQMLCASLAYAIDPNTPITNTATASYLASGSPVETSSSVTIVADPFAGNSPPTGLTLTNFEVPENDDGVVLGVLDATDTDSTDTHTFSVSDDRFIVDGDSLQLAPGTVFNFEVDAPIVLEVTVVDAAGQSAVVPVTVTILDVNEAPDSITLEATSVPPNAPGAVIGPLSVTDPDNVDNHTFTVDDNRFVVVGSELRLAPGVSLPPGPPITVVITATDKGGLTISTPHTLQVGLPANTAVIDFFAPDSVLGSPQNVPLTSCSDNAATSGSFAAIATSNEADGTLYTFPLSIDLSSTSVYRAGGTAFFRVSDAGANLDPAVIDSVFVRLEGTAGDAETLAISETGTDTGEFFGYIQTVAVSSAPGDCVLFVAPNDQIFATYTNAIDGSIFASTAAVVNPRSRVFGAVDGHLIDGALITLIDAATGNPAAVFGDDGASAFPSTLLSGSTVTDASGTVYAFGTGEFRFPTLAPGQYRYEIVPPGRYVFPSVVTDAELQTLSGAPFSLEPGSRGDPLAVGQSGLFVVDVPLDLQLQPPTPAIGRLHRAIRETGGDLLVSDPQGICVAGGSDIVLAPATDSVGIDYPVTDLSLVTNTLYSAGDALFVEIVDPDQDLSLNAVDTVRVSISSANGADHESIVLTETDLSSGVFVGYIQSTEGASVPGDCLVSSPNGADILFSYIDPDDEEDSIDLVGGIDATGLVFNAVDGSLVDGVRITLVDAVTGQPVTVLAADGVSGFPSTVVSGGSVTDDAGRVTNFAPGQFSFPIVAPGSYRLLVEPPAGLGFPTLASDDELSLFFEGPFERGEVFTLTNARSVGGSVPVDVLAAQVFIEKIASRDTVAVGDVVQYSLNVNNPANGRLGELVLHDQLPRGFRLVEDSLRFDGAVPNGTPVTFDSTGRSLTIALPDIGPLEVLALTYVVEVTPGAREGRAVNNAWVSGQGVATSNRAQAVVFVQDDLLRNFGTIVGQVLAGPCNEPGVPVPGVRVLLEDGTFVLTDEQGRYHVEGLQPGAHVVHLEVSTLPRDLEPLACERNNRFAESSTTQFVELQGGSLWRADFRVQAPGVAQGPLQGRLLARYKNGEMQYRYLLQGDAPQPLSAFRLEVLLPEGLDYTRGSATFDGLPTPGTGPDRDGLVFFELDLPEGEFSAQLMFRAKVAGREQRYATRATARFRMGDFAHQLPQVVASVNTAAPSSLNITAISDSDARADQRGIVWQETEDVQTPAQRAARKRALGISDRNPKGGENSSNRDKPLGAWHASDRRTAQPLKSRQVAAGEEADVKIRVAEPGSGAISAASEVAVVQLTGERTIHSPVPDVLPDIEPDPRPDFDAQWLATQNEAAEFVWPLVDSNPANPAIAVAVKHKLGVRPSLLVNGALVDPLTFDSIVVNREQGNAVTLWKNVVLNDGYNMLSSQFETQDGTQIESIQRVAWLSGVPVRAELALESSNLIADGITPPVVAVRLFDREDRPARPGMTGEFNLSAPYRTLDENKALSQLSDSSRQGIQRYIVRSDGVAYLALEPTTEAGEVQLYFAFDRNRQKNIRARLKPVAREWVLVGLAEGTLGYNTIAPHEQPLDGDAPEDVMTDGRLSFYAKGQVRGEWLLTLGYDSDRSEDRNFRRQIDPNRFYTLYGDGAEQAFDNDTSRQLYLKLERDVAALLVGDFDTQLSRGELTRYSRRLNGIKADYYQGDWKASVFGANTDQGFLLDTIAGDGTSGVYRLSRGGLVRNGERVRIVVRDRFALDQVLSTVSLSRFVDYSIDYDAGTLIFKRPIESQDASFNPQFIEVEYEIDGRQNEIVAGGRVAYAPGLGENEVGISYVDDATPGVGGSLVGLDAEWQFGASNRIEAEAAATDSDATGKGEAFRAEFLHESERIAGKIFFREQDASFGLGQQSALTTGLRRFGVEGEVRVRNELTVRAEAQRQQDLGVGGGERDIYGVEADYRLRSTSLLLGARKVDETAASGRNLQSEQLLAGIAQPLFQGRMQLRGNAEIGLNSGGDSADFPTRVIGGVDYRLPKGITVFAEQEFTWGSDRDTQDTRAGIRAQSWIGANVHTRVDRQISENAERLFATSGVLQQFRISDYWLLDVGLDRVNTLEENGLADDPDGLVFAPRQPAASGAFSNALSTTGLQLNEDFTAGFVGLGYRREQWDASARIEYHSGDRSDRANLLLGISHQLRDGNIFSLSGAVFDEDTAEGIERRTTDLRFGIAWRPVNSRWTTLSRLDLSQDDLLDSTFDTRTRKIVHNMNINYKRDPYRNLDADEDPRPGLEWSLNLGNKYVRDRIGDDHFGGYTGLLGFAARYDVTPKWTLGSQANVTYAAFSDVASVSAGLTVSRSLRRDMWVRLGYNFTGFVDDDFVAADYTRHGPFLQFRLKVDRNSVRRFVERLPGIRARNADAGSDTGFDMSQFGGWE